MTKSEKDTIFKILWDIDDPKKVSRQDRMLLEQLQKKQSQIVSCGSRQILRARDGIKEVSD
jgi:hypothetical protein